jgi:predicted RNA binding protein YcfA (HicA-like mRNA interferase family)
MSKLPSLSTLQVVRVLRQAGFVDAPVRGKGSHTALTKTEPNGTLRLVIVPDRKDIPIGTLVAIIKQAGLTRDQFLDLLR